MQDFRFIPVVLLFFLLPNLGLAGEQLDVHDGSAITMNVSSKWSHCRKLV